MIAKNWSLSALSAELAIDRRTLAKRLTGLTPDEELQQGKRTERRWLLARVVAHLANPDGEELDLSQERAALARVQRLKVELDLQIKRGEVVSLDAVEQHWTGMVASMRATLLALPSRLATQVAPPDRYAQAQEAARVLVHEALDHIARDGLPSEIKQRRAKNSSVDGP